MYNIGDYIVYGQKGVCRVGEITHMDTDGELSEKPYYTVYPVNDIRSKVYFPVDTVSSSVRKVMTKQEALALLEQSEKIEIITQSNPKLREEQYKKAILGSDCVKLMQVIKTIYIHKQERIKEGKKMTAADARCLKQAEEKLYGELAFVLDKSKLDVEQELAARLNL